MAGFDYTKAAGLGTETIDQGVLGPPFINIIQKGSPEFDETHKDYNVKRIDGCRPGQLLFEPKREIIPTPLSVIPLAQVSMYTGWKPNKGGFAGNFPLSIVDERNYRKGGAPGSKDQYKEYLGELEMVFTITFMLLFWHKEKWQKGMINFTSTQLKHARNWSKMILNLKLPGNQTVTPPMFAGRYNLSTEPDKNDRGGWFAWKIEGAGILDAEKDQALLETAFVEAKQAQLSLPKPSQAALPSGQVNVEKADPPY